LHGLVVERRGRPTTRSPAKWLCQKP
jgi:hypothetical protein